MSNPRWGRLIVACVVTVLTCLTAGPASAHSALIGSTPENGSTLSTVPETVALEFNEEVGEISPAMVLRNSSEDAIEQLTPQIEGRTMSGRLPAGLTSGDYSVAWRIVSVDGHPIQGVVEFGLDLPAEATDPTAEPTPTPVEEDPADAAVETSRQDSSWIPWTVGGVALAAVALAAVLAMRRRGRQDEA